MLKLQWTDFKAYAIANGLPMRGFETSEEYTVYASDAGFTVFTTLDRDPSDTTDRDDYVNNYKSRANTALGQYDTDGASIVRNKAAKKGWTFCSMPLEFQTARLGSSLYSQDVAGVARPFISLKAYDINDVEVTQPGEADLNYTTIVKSVIDFEPPYDYEIIGGDLRTLTNINTDVRLWLIAAPDIAAPTGSKEMGGGINLRYLQPGNIFSVDGRVTKFATYNANAHSNKIRMVFKYDAGTCENLMVVIQLYKQ